MTVDIVCPRRVPTPLPCCCALVPTPPDPRRTHEAHTPMRARQADSRCKCVLPAILHAYVQKRRSQSVCTTVYEPWKVGSQSSTKTRALQPSYCPRKRVYRVKNRQFSLARAYRRSRECVSCPGGARQKALGKRSKIVNFLRGAPPRAPLGLPPQTPIS